MTSLSLWSAITDAGQRVAVDEAYEKLRLLVAAAHQLRESLLRPVPDRRTLPQT